MGKNIKGLENTGKNLIINFKKVLMSWFKINMIIGNQSNNEYLITNWKLFVKCMVVENMCNMKQS